MQHSLITHLTDQFSQAIGSAFPDLSPEEAGAEVTVSTNERFGHYQCNNAMKLSKLLKKNPREIATAIVEAYPGEGSLEIAGPGFINLTLPDSFITDRTNKVFEDPRLGVPKVDRPLRAVVEFSSPNTAKEMHVGHLRSTIIGESLARLLEFLGHDVLRLNHVGDWGTQFGMLIAYMKEEVPAALSGEQESTLTDLVSWYKESKRRFDADPDFKKRSQNEVVALQGGDPESLKAWNRICAISRVAYQEIYDLLDVTLQERGESFYNPVLAQTIADLEAKGLVQESHGAKCIFLDGYTNREGDPLPMIVQKSDGGYNYSTTDMAAMRQRVSEEKGEWIIVITDAGQATHMSMIADACEKAGWLDRSKVRFDHVTFGLVLGPDGKKFRTRSGETERLMDLLDTAIQRSKAILSERDADMDDQTLEETAKAIGLGAVKYADLSCNRSQDYTFSYDRMLSFEGNTAVFLLYSYVRINGIKRKVGATDLSGKIALKHPSEVALGLHLCRFAEVVESVARDLLPNRLTDYLYTLAERFNAFFRDCRVEGSDEQASRLLLCEATSRILKQGLSLLGLQTVERM